MGVKKGLRDGLIDYTRKDSHRTQIMFCQAFPGMCAAWYQWLITKSRTLNHPSNELDLVLKSLT